jgi:hypothetical protein
MVSSLEAICSFMVCNFVFHTNRDEVSTVRFSYLLSLSFSLALKMLYLGVFSNYSYQVITLQTS